MLELKQLSSIAWWKTCDVTQYALKHRLRTHDFPNSLRPILYIFGLYLGYDREAKLKNNWMMEITMPKGTADSLAKNTPNTPSIIRPIYTKNWEIVEKKDSSGLRSPCCEGWLYNSKYQIEHHKFTITTSRLFIQIRTVGTGVAGGGRREIASPNFRCRSKTFLFKILCMYYIRTTTPLALYFTLCLTSCCYHRQNSITIVCSCYLNCWVGKTLLHWAKSDVISDQKCMIDFFILADIFGPVSTVRAPL